MQPLSPFKRLRLLLAQSGNLPTTIITHKKSLPERQSVTARLFGVPAKGVTGD
jgi:hypothetical protein